MKVLAPLDGSRLADGILAHVRRVLMRESSEIHLLRVLEEETEEERREARATGAQKHLDECRELLESTGETVVASFTEGEPADRILAYAEAHDVDLIAMATHGRSGVDRFVRGSVAERVLRNAPVPIYLANPKGILRSSDEIRFERILVPLDGSELSAKVLPLVADLARDSKAEIVLLHVDKPDAGAVHPVPEVAKKRCHTRAEKQLAPFREVMGADGVDVHVTGRYGDPASEILDVVEEQSIDLVAMSSHGRTGVSRWRWGSVAEKVLRNCRCPLLVRPAKKDWS